ncbi:hypothetical protein ScPMuIL_008423 [Solemya velum]
MAITSATEVSLACEHKTALLTCPGNGKIHIAFVNYGRTDKSTCPSKAMKTTSCFSGTAAERKVTSLCEGKTSCSVKADNGNMKGDPCQGTFKYLRVVYYCM